jgi:hypothetical protein
MTFMRVNIEGDYCDYELRFYKRFNISVVDSTLCVPHKHIHLECMS